MKLRTLTFVALAPIVFVACGGSSSSSDTTVVSSSSVAAGTVEKSFTIGTDTGKDVVFEVQQGDNVKLTFVNPNGNDEVHLHDYDITTGEMAKGVSSSISFTADKTGDFEVESHVTEELLLTLRVIAQ
jgi:ABC-type Zn uptake system ZnuABC Zn-binding protein ZnuA